MKYMDAEKLIIAEKGKKNSLWNNLDEKYNYNRISNYRKTSSEISGVFSAPPGVNPFHVAATEVRKLSAGGPKLVFIWPQKAPNKKSISSILVPIFRFFLIGLIMLDTLHFWPGEFLPTSLPSPVLLPLSPIKYNVIEPRWSDNNL